MRQAEADGTIDEARADIAASFQRAAVDTLIGRTLQAAKHVSQERIVVAGGVGANQRLRSELAARFPGDVFYPRAEYCTDNGAMIARWSLESLAPPGQDQA